MSEDDFFPRIELYSKRSLLILKPLSLLVAIIVGISQLYQLAHIDKLLGGFLANKIGLLHMVDQTIRAISFFVFFAVNVLVASSVCLDQVKFIFLGQTKKGRLVLCYLFYGYIYCAALSNALASAKLP